MKIKRKNHTLSSKENKLETPSMTSTIKETFFAGFGLGVGSEIAHRAVSAILGPRQITIEHPSYKEEKCQEFRNKYGFPCPLGVRGRNSDNKLYREKVGWESKLTLREGMEKTYNWIEKQVQENQSKNVYIYESPDKGNTIYRREFGKLEREVI